MKKDWIEMFDAIARCVNEADPAGLMDAGAPDDEYEMQVLKIFVEIKNRNLGAVNVHEVLSGIFRKSFGQDTHINQAVSTI